MDTGQSLHDRITLRSYGTLVYTTIFIDYYRMSVANYKANFKDSLTWWPAILAEKKLLRGHNKLP